MSLPQPEKYAFPIETTYAIIPTYPNGMISFQLVEWLHFVGIPAERLRTFNHVGRDVVCGYNYAIKHMALQTPGTHFIFADNDIRPNPWQTKRFLDLPDADIVSCEYEGEFKCESQWTAETSFHCALWRCHRAVLERMPRPWFRYDTKDDGCEPRACACTSFGELALRSGFTIRHGGFCQHTPRKKQ